MYLVHSVQFGDTAHFMYFVSPHVYFYVTKYYVVEVAIPFLLDLFQPYILILQLL